MPKWNEMSKFEKIMTVLEWIIVIAYIVTIVINKWEITAATNYLLGVVFLLSGLICIRTKKNIAIFYIIIAIIDAITVTCFTFMK